MPTSRAEAFGQALREARLERGLSQEAAALAGNIDRSYWGHIERATVAASITTIWRAADALHVPPSGIFQRAEKILEEQV